MSNTFVWVAAPDLGSEDVYGVWRIDDTDHSFSTQPFRIKYARQDILLSMMVSFNLSLSKHEVISLELSPHVYISPLPPCPPTFTHQRCINVGFVLVITVKQQGRLVQLKYVPTLFKHFRHIGYLEPLYLSLS